MTDPVIVVTVLSVIAAIAAIAWCGTLLPPINPFDPNRDFILEMGCLLAAVPAVLVVQGVAYLIGFRY